MGIGDWGLGIGPNPQSPIPNPQSPIPNPQVISKLFILIFLIYFLKIKLNFKKLSFIRFIRYIRFLI